MRKSLDEANNAFKEAIYIANIPSSNLDDSFILSCSKQDKNWWQKIWAFIARDKATHSCSYQKSPPEEPAAPDFESELFNTYFSSEKAFLNFAELNDKNARKAYDFAKYLKLNYIKAKIHLDNTKLAVSNIHDILHNMPEFAILAQAEHNNATPLVFIQNMLRTLNCEVDRISSLIQNQEDIPIYKLGILKNDVVSIAPFNITVYEPVISQIDVTADTASAEDIIANTISIAQKYYNIFEDHFSSLEKYKDINYDLQHAKLGYSNLSRYVNNLEKDLKTYLEEKHYHLLDKKIKISLGLSTLNKAYDGAKEISNIIDRLRENQLDLDNTLKEDLESDLSYFQNQYASLIEKIDNTVENTRFNDLKLLDGTFRFQIHELIDGISNPINFMLLGISSYTLNLSDSDNVKNLPAMYALLKMSYSVITGIKADILAHKARFLFAEKNTIEALNLNIQHQNMLISDVVCPDTQKEMFWDSWTDLVCPTNIKVNDSALQILTSNRIKENNEAFSDLLNDHMQAEYNEHYVKELNEYYCDSTANCFWNDYE